RGACRPGGPGAPGSPTERDTWRRPGSAAVSPNEPIVPRRRPESGPRPGELVTLPVDAIQPCPIQPRVNVSVELVERLADSMREGRHQPVLEVEPVPGRPGRYQIVCGEQRWRAARAAGLGEVLVRV